MRRAAAPVAALLLAACGPSAPDTTPGARIEAAAVQAGLVADPARASIEGMWARGSDRLCIVPAPGPESGDSRRIGLVLDHGPGERCIARGTVRRRDDRLDVRFSDCRIDAAFDGDRIVFPSAIPAACDAICTGRASLAAVAVDRLSASLSEAASLRTPRGHPVCAGT